MELPADYRDHHRSYFRPQKAIINGVEKRVRVLKRAKGNRMTDAFVNGAKPVRNRRIRRREQYIVDGLLREAGLR